MTAKGIAEPQQQTRPRLPQLQQRGCVVRWMRYILLSMVWLVSVSSFLLVIAWLIGRVLTDRYAWSQWLWWIPTPATLLAVTIGLLTSLRGARSQRVRRNRTLRWATSALGVIAYFVVIEHRFLHTAAPMPQTGQALSMLHWNYAHERSVSDETVIDRVIEMNPDIAVLTGYPSLAYQTRLVEHLHAGNGAFVLGTLTILTRLPVLAFRPLIVNEGVFAAWVELDATEVIGKPISILMLDMPSSPKHRRMALARKVRSMLDESNTPTPDLVVGDFNITRGSASIGAMFPGMTEAYEQAGHSYGASFHRAFPLYLIDHVMLSANVNALRYDLVDAGVSRHKVQQVWIVSGREN